MPTAIVAKPWIQETNLNAIFIRVRKARSRFVGHARVIICISRNNELLFNKSGQEDLEDQTVDPHQSSLVCTAPKDV